MADRVGRAVVPRGQVELPPKCHQCALVARGKLTDVEFEKLLECGERRIAARRTLTGDARKRTYERLRGDATSSWNGILSHARDLLGRRAARGAGDFDAAWSAAVLGWIGRRTPGRPSITRRTGLFVTQTLIPERAQARTGSGSMPNLP